MRKNVGFVLLGLAGFLLTVAVLALVYVPGQVKKTPLDVNSTTRLTGEAAKLPTGDPGPVRAVSRTAADGQDSDGDVVVFDTFSCLMRDVPGAPDCTEDTSEGSPLVTAGTDRFATDRRTAESVDAAKAADVGAEVHEGLVNKWPFDPEQKTYKYWDGLLGRAVDAVYQGEEEVDGVAAYKYLVTITDEPAEISKGIAGLYSDEKTLWIDKGTGSILDQEERQVRTLEDGTVALEVNLGFTDETIAANVEDAKANNSQLSLVKAAPLVLGLLGLLALAGGAFLSLVGRGRHGGDDGQNISLEEMRTSRR
jgi:hypothetical protein